MTKHTRKPQVLSVLPPVRKPPLGALFRCSCGGYVVRDRSASYMRGFRADSCDSCNCIQ
jgi:hypothetical protein